MTADYNGWADRPEDEREAVEAVEERYAAQESGAAQAGVSGGAMAGAIAPAVFLGVRPIDSNPAVPFRNVMPLV